MTAPLPRRSDFTYSLEIATRWNDNDILRHVNNVKYYTYLEAIIVRFVMEELKIDWFTSPTIPFVVESRCHFRKPLKFPDVVDARLRVSEIGSSSFRYDLGLFRQGDDTPAATGDWVHVLVDRHNERPVPVPDDLRATLERFQKSPSPR